jgi:hypothetical protein
LLVVEGGEAFVPEFELGVVAEEEIVQSFQIWSKRVKDLIDLQA